MHSCSSSDSAKRGGGRVTVWKKRASFITCKPENFQFLFTNHSQLGNFLKVEVVSLQPPNTHIPPPSRSPPWMLPSILPRAKTLFWRRHWLAASPEAWLPHVLSISRYGMGSQPNQLIQPTASDLPKPVDWGKLGRNPTIILPLTGHGSLSPPLQGAVAAARIYLLVSAVDPEAVNPGAGS